MLPLLIRSQRKVVKASIKYMAKGNLPDIIRRRVERCQELAESVFANVEINKNLYRGILNVDDDYDWEYSLVDPQIFPLVRNYLARSNPTMSSLKLNMRRDGEEETRKVNQDFVNWEIGEIMATTLYYRMFFSAYVAGKGYCKTGWKYEPAIEIEEKDDDGEVKRKKIMRDVTNRADAKFVRFNNILIPDRNIPNLQDQPYMFEAMHQNIGEMLDENKSLEESGEKPYWDEEWIETLKKSGVTDKVLSYEMERATDSDAGEEFAFRSSSVALYCMHTNQSEVFYLPVEGEDKIVNKSTENRYWHGHYPYIDFSAFPEDDEYFNLSLVDITGDLQIAATEILNQSLTNIRSVNNAMWIAGSTASQTPDWQFKQRPDGVIRVLGDASQIQQITTKDNTRSATALAELLGQKIEKAGGISSLYSSGVGARGINQTARGAQIIDSNIDENMKMIVDLFGEQVLKRMGEHFLELNSQYVTEEQSFAVTGKRGVSELIKIKPEQTSANFIVFVDTDRIQKQTPASRQASLQNSITILQDIETKSQGGVQLDLTPVVEALVNETQALDNVDEIIISLDEKSGRDVAMIERSQLPTIKIRDAHEDLIVAVNVYFGDIEKLESTVQEVLEKYVEEHLKFIQAKAEVAAMKQPILPPGLGASGAGNAIFDPAQGTQQGLPGATSNLGNIVRG